MFEVYVKHVRLGNPCTPDEEERWTTGGVPSRFRTEVVTEGREERGREGRVTLVVRLRETLSRPLGSKYSGR